MATAPKIVKMRRAIEPELKAFLDEILVPMLVRDALGDIAAEKILVLQKPSLEFSTASDDRDIGGNSTETA